MTSSYGSRRSTVSDVLSLPSDPSPFADGDIHVAFSSRLVGAHFAVRGNNLPIVSTSLLRKLAVC